MDKKMIEFQIKCDEFWAYHGAKCQTSLIDTLLIHEIDGFSWLDVENLAGDADDCDLDEGECAPDKEVLEWWLVDQRLARYLREHGEPILENEYGTWWGRCTSGQAVSMDSVIEDILCEIYNIERPE